MYWIQVPLLFLYRPPTDERGIFILSKHSPCKEGHFRHSTDYIYSLCQYRILNRFKFVALSGCPSVRLCNVVNVLRATKIHLPISNLHKYIGSSCRQVDIENGPNLSKNTSTVLRKLRIPLVFERNKKKLVFCSLLMKYSK